MRLLNFAGPLWEDSGLVFTNETGRYLFKQTVYIAFKRLTARAGITGVNIHSLRHTYAVNALQAGNDIKSVQENLGHHTAAFTLDTYAHVTDDMRQASAARMETFIKQILDL